MNLFKKVTYSSMALLLALGLSACGNNEENEGQTEENPTTDETSEEETDQATSDDGEIPTLVYLNIGTPPQGNDEVVAAINDYLDSQDAGYHLDLTFYDWGDYEQKLQLASSTGEDWDMAFTANWAGPYKTLVNQNALMDLTDLMEGKEFVDLINPDMIKGVSVDGKVYGIPAAYPGAVAANQFVWTKSFVDKYDIDYESIKDAKDLEPILKKIKEEEGMQYPFGVSKDFLFAMPEPVYKVTEGVAVKEEDGKLIAYNLYADDLYKEQIGVMKKYMDEGLVSPSAPQTEAGTVFPENEVLVTEGEGEPGSNAIWSNDIRGEVVSSLVGDEIMISNDKATGKMISLNSQTDKADLAMDFINRMFTDQKLQDMLSYGIEGKHYELVDGKVRKFNQEEDGAANEYDVPSFTFLSAFNRTPLAGAPGIGDEEFDQEAKEFEESLVASPVLGFTIDETNVETEIANIQQTQEQYTTNLKTGAFDESYYQEFLDKLDTAGIQKVVDEVQSQLDNWDPEA
ncbi:MAG: ABC transporter substrate-binding protein [Anaerococcus sp.]|nr:ABC transporter substrate-binding protein [Anaerococcus sp.]